MTSQADLLQKAGEEGESLRGSQEVQYTVFHLTIVTSNKNEHDCKSVFEYGEWQGLDRLKVDVVLLYGVQSQGRSDSVQMTPNLAFLKRALQGFSSLDSRP